MKALTILCIDVQVGSIRKRSTPAYNLQFKIIKYINTSISIYIYVLGGKKSILVQIKTEPIHLHDREHYECVI